MKKKILRLIVILLSFSTLSTPLVASANVGDSNSVEIQSLSYGKMVTKIYPLSDYYSGQLPETIFVSETKGRQYYRGRLPLVDFIINKDQKIEATYRGIMYPADPGVTPLQIRK